MLISLIFFSLKPAYGLDASTDSDASDVVTIYDKCPPFWELVKPWNPLLECLGHYEMFVFHVGTGIYRKFKVDLNLRQHAYVSSEVSCCRESLSLCTQLHAIEFLYHTCKTYIA